MASPRFLELIDQMRSVAAAKNSDYADSESDPWKNFRLSEMAGIPAFDGCLTRMSDKFARVMNLRNKERSGREVGVKDEAITDTLLDLANYALIAICLHEELTAQSAPQEQYITFEEMYRESIPEAVKEALLRNELEKIKERVEQESGYPHTPGSRTLLYQPVPFIGMTPEQAMENFRRAVEAKNLGNVGGSGSTPVEGAG